MSNFLGSLHYGARGRFLLNEDCQEVCRYKGYGKTYEIRLVEFDLSLKNEHSHEIRYGKDGGQEKRTSRKIFQQLNAVEGENHERGEGEGITVPFLGERLHLFRSHFAPQQVAYRIGEQSETRKDGNRRDFPRAERIVEIVIILFERLTKFAQSLGTVRHFLLEETGDPIRRIDGNGIEQRIRLRDIERHRQVEGNGQADGDENHEQAVEDVVHEGGKQRRDAEHGEG